MPKQKDPIRVFLDANLVIQAGKPPGGPLISRVADLVKANLVEIITTDLTITEVAKKHAENDYEIVKEIGRPHFRKIVSDFFGVKLPEQSKPEVRLEILKAYQSLTEDMFAVLEAEVLKIDDIKPSTIFQAYSENTGLFSGESKQDQFSDAFIFECLKSVADKNSPIVIVSEDGDFETPVKNTPTVSLLKSIPELFKKLGLEIEPPDVDEFIKNHSDDLIQKAGSALSDWGLMASDVEDADIEDIETTNVEIVEFAAFGPVEKGESVLIVGKAKITATVWFTHPDWDTAMYDSEEKVLIPFDSVSGESEATLNVAFSMSLLTDEYGEIAEIEEFQFRDDTFVYINLYSYEDYK